MNKDIFFDATQLDQLSQEYFKVHEKYERLLLKYEKLNLKNTIAAEYCTHGFLRRLAILKRCIENIYTICPPKNSCKLSWDDLYDLTINFQSFIFSVFGCIDNLAWIWVNEKQLKNKKGHLLTGKAVGLMSKDNNKIVRESFSQSFQNYLNASIQWYDEYLTGYRHALAHRIPLFIPPFCLNPEEVKKYESLEKQKTEARRKEDFHLLSQLNGKQTLLGKFIPLMQHSLGEGSCPVVFHAQILADWNTIVEISEKFLDEF